MFVYSSLSKWRTSTKDYQCHLKKILSRVCHGRLKLKLDLSSHQSVGQINATQHELVGWSKGRDNFSAGGVIALLRKTGSFITKAANKGNNIKKRRMKYSIRLRWLLRWWRAIRRRMSRKHRERCRCQHRWGRSMEHREGRWSRCIRDRW